MPKDLNCNGYEILKKQIQLHHLNQDNSIIEGNKIGNHLDLNNQNKLYNKV